MKNKALYAPQTRTGAAWLHLRGVSPPVAEVASPLLETEHFAVFLMGMFIPKE